MENWSTNTLSPPLWGKIWCGPFWWAALSVPQGQGLSNLYQNWGMDQDAAGGAVSITLILAAALLTGLGWFDKLAKRAGAGTLVPITGFANTMVSPALEFKSEGLITAQRLSCS